MELNSTGQVSSLIPEPTRPNAPAKPQSEAAVATAPTGGTTDAARSATVVNVDGDVDAGNDRKAPEPKEAVSSVDITV